MIWEMPLVESVADMYLDNLVPDEQVASAAIDVLHEAGNRTAFVFVSQVANKLNVQVDARDVSCERSRDETLNATKLRVQWQPTSNMVELRGGPKDGTQIDINKMGGEGMFAQAILPFDVSKPTDVTNLWVYTPAGWNPDNRCWVYDVHPVSDWDVGE